MLIAHLYFDYTFSNKDRLSYSLDAYLLTVRGRSVDCTDNDVPGPGDCARGAAVCGTLPALLQQGQELRARPRQGRLPDDRRGRKATQCGHMSRSCGSLQLVNTCIIHYVLYCNKLYI